MNKWTREHDAVIAAECEGIKVLDGYEREDPSLYGDAWGVPLIPIPSYDVSVVDRIAAAEAWRRREPGRSYEVYSAIDDSYGGRPESAACYGGPNQIAGTGRGRASLAWALYRSVTVGDYEDQ